MGFQLEMPGRWTTRQWERITSYLPSTPKSKPNGWTPSDEKKRQLLWTELQVCNIISSCYVTGVRVHSGYSVQCLNEDEESSSCPLFDLLRGSQCSREEKEF